MSDTQKKDLVFNSLAEYEAHLLEVAARRGKLLLMMISPPTSEIGKRAAQEAGKAFARSGSRTLKI